MLGHRSMIALKFRKMVHRFDGVTEEGDLLPVPGATLCSQRDIVVERLEDL